MVFIFHYHGALCCHIVFIIFLDCARMFAKIDPKQQRTVMFLCETFVYEAVVDNIMKGKCKRRCYCTLTL